MALQFYNTMTRQKEDFKPIDKDSVSLYTCGPTVYNYVHIGNLRTFLFEDILVRYLKFKGFKVRQIMNLTDVDDKTIKNSIKNNMSLNDYTKQFKDAFFDDIKTLNITPAEVYPCATDHVQEMVDMIQKLEEKGIAYRSDGSIYFSINNYKEYGKLAHLDKVELKAGASERVENDEYDKDNVSDFVLWKGYTEEDGEVYWETPLGKGRPGWHIECSAMSMKYLGESFDIHTGGVDNIFPHHENEIAQSEGATGKTFVNYWMHSEFLNFKGRKMSKRLGNVTYLRELIDGSYDRRLLGVDADEGQKAWSKEVVRYSLIQSHYRSRFDFSESLLVDSGNTIDNLNHFIKRCQQINKEEKSEINLDAILSEGLKGFEEGMDDDLNMPAALSAMFEAIKEINKVFDQLNIEDGKKVIEFLKRIDSVIAVMSFEKEILDEEIQALIDERNNARKNKNFQRADEIRDQLKEQGIVLEDTADGVVWKRQ